MKNTKNKFGSSQGEIISHDQLHKIYFKNRWLLGSKFTAKKLAEILVEKGYLKISDSGALIIVNLPNSGFVNETLQDNAVLLPPNPGKGGVLNRLVGTTLPRRSINAVLISIFAIFQILVFLEWGRPAFSVVKQNLINTMHKGVGYETK